jgi:kumamolisin
VGFIHPLLYAQTMPAGVFHDVTQGNNDIYNALKGEFPAGPGWDPCTGLGSVDGTKLLAALPNLQPAVPQPPVTSAKRAGKG